MYVCCCCYYIIQGISPRLNTMSSFYECLSVTVVDVEKGWILLSKVYIPGGV